MKKVRQLIKLSNINSECLNEKRLNHVIGGLSDCCSCSCFYAACGGSSRYANGVANDNGGGVDGCLVSVLPSEDVECGIVV